MALRLLAIPGSKEAARHEHRALGAAQRCATLCFDRHRAHPSEYRILSFGGQVLLAPDGDRLPYAVSVAKTRTYLGSWLRAARESRGWTQDRLGDALGVTKQNVSHWETGKHEPSFEQILRIRDLTGHPLRDISAAIDWPLARIPRERITSLTPTQIEQLQAGLIGILAAITKDHELGGDLPLYSRVLIGNKQRS